MLYRIKLKNAIKDGQFTELKTRECEVILLVSLVTQDILVKLENRGVKTKLINKFVLNRPKVAISNSKAKACQID